MGNPTRYRGHSLKWDRVRLLTQWDNLSFSYNASGIRTRKGDTYYELDGDSIISETTNGNTIRYYYGNDGITAFRYNGQRYYYEKNLQGDIVGIYDENSNKVGEYAYDAWGTCTITANTNNVANVNPFRYRSYYYDADLGLYYLKSRYYDPQTCRFVNADEIGYLGANKDLCAHNLFAYCSDNPIKYTDSTGYLIDVILDVVFICWDIYDLATDDGYKDLENWGALGLDIVFAAFPFFTGGGQIVKFGGTLDNISDLSKVTVIGETMSRVEDVAQIVNASDNLYRGFKYYQHLSNLSVAGKALAELAGKTSNIMWLYDKLRKGYTIIDIGIDITRTTRSSSYAVERIGIMMWETRNAWKISYHLDE